MRLSRNEMQNWKRPDVPNAVVWEAEYCWLGMDKRHTIHMPDMIEDVVHGMASLFKLDYMDVYPIDDCGRRIRETPDEQLPRLRSPMNGEISNNSIYEKLAQRGIYLRPPQPGDRFDVVIRSHIDALLTLMEQVDRDYPAKGARPSTTQLVDEPTDSGHFP